AAHPRLHRPALGHHLVLRHRPAAGAAEFRFHRCSRPPPNSPRCCAMIQPHHRIFGCFFLFAFALGALLARLPDIQEHHGLTESQLGLTLIAMALGSLISLSLSSPWIERMGARRTAILTVIGTALCYAIVPW